MKNLKLVTLLLSLFLSFIINTGNAQRNDLAVLGQNHAESGWMAGTRSENENPPVNPLTTHFSVLPRITVNDNGNVFVYIFNPRHIPISVGFIDKHGNTLHHDKTNTLYYGKLLNVSELESGEYELTLNSDSVAARYVVKIGLEARVIKVNEAVIL